MNQECAHNFVQKEGVLVCIGCGETETFIKEQQSLQATPQTPSPANPKITQLPVQIRNSGVATPFPLGLHVLMEAAAANGRLRFEAINDFERICLQWIQQNFPTPEAAASLVLPNHLAKPPIAWPGHARAQDVFKACTMLHILLIDMKTKFAQVVREAKEMNQALGEKQVQIDNLMHEYCPEEMTQEQIAVWESNQRAVPESSVSAPANEGVIKS